MNSSNFTKTIFECMRLKSLCFWPLRKSFCSEVHRTDSWPQRVFSGIQPTGAIHLGNYFGAVARWRELQDGGANTMCCIADLHSITLPQEPLQLKKNIYQMTATLLACGIDPEKTILFQQSQVPQHAELCWVLACHSTMARLAHLPQFREKSASLKEVPVGIYVYPVLQAADILLYSRLRSLRDPQKKMSKSDADPRSRIELMDSPADIREKCKKAVTDFTSAVTFNPVSRPGVSNLITIHSLLSGLSPEDICRDSSGLDTGRYKLVVAEVIAKNIAPIREKVIHIMSKHQYLDDVLESGAEKAVRIARETWNDVKNKVGFTYLL
ncbi:tryptophan--tRNA ligase, mitochondrial isoform X2 [Bacillus rossius redtenbacheri]|uniref:tryptophan--tRNA ligase, mitochondrial isoform X2 n=1 Tax=Bacillus rossius redtenbacheri TaxID=93214 RepID=UPI002FDEE454